MSEYINRDDALNCFHDWVDKHGDVICADDTAEYIEIANLPSIEVVRCRDCKYQDKGENESEAWNTCGLRPWVHVPTSDDHFCASGERKDGEQE